MMDIKMLVSNNFIKAYFDGEEGEINEAIYCMVQRHCGVQMKGCIKPGKDINPPPLLVEQKSTQYALLLRDLVKISSQPFP